MRSKVSIRFLSLLLALLWATFIVVLATLVRGGPCVVHQCGFVDHFLPVRMVYIVFGV